MSRTISSGSRAACDGGPTREDRHDVAEHRRGGLDPSRARPGHGDLGDRRRLDHHGVERPLDRGQRMVRIQEAGEYPDAEPAVAALGDAEQLQRQAELLGVGDVVGLDLGDPLVGDVVERHRGAEGQPGEDRHLRRRVGAVDVVGRIGLGVAELLGAAQGVRVGRARAGHLREDEVRRPVDDPEHLGDLGRREALLDHPDHRHHAGHRRLEAKLHARVAGGVEELVPVLGDQLLVRGHHVAPGPQRSQARSRAPGRCRRSARRRSPSRPGCGRSRPRVRRSTPTISGRRPEDAAIASARFDDQVAEGRADRAQRPGARSARPQSASRATRSSQVSRRTTTRASPSLQKTTGGRGTPL